MSAEDKGDIAVLEDSENKGHERRGGRVARDDMLKRGGGALAGYREYNTHFLDA